MTSLAALWGGPAVVSGLARFRPSGSLLRVEAERIDPAGDRDLALWGALPGLLFGPPDERSLRQPRGARSGGSAIVGELPDDESDQEIIEALDRFS